MANICIFLLLILPSIYGQESGAFMFILYNEPKTWTEAQSFCRVAHIDLATLQNENDYQVLSSSTGWVGMYREDDDSPWKWSSGDVEATFFKWKINEPQKNLGEYCVTKHEDNLWNSRCENKKPFICYDYKLVLVKNNKTWEEALEHCRSLWEQGSGNPDSAYGNHNYDLASLITEDDLQYARERAQQATTEEVWTGLRFLGDQWFWVSGEEVQYQDISSCPAFGCGILEKNGNTKFGIRDCSQRRNFFCSKKS